MTSTALPDYLNGNRPQGVVADEPIAQFEIGDLRNFVYLLIDWKTKSCAIVDPQTDVSSIEQALAKHKLLPSAILLTHTHHDHVGGLGSLVTVFPKIPIHVHKQDLYRLNEKLRETARIELIQDGQDIDVGTLKIKVMHTPGHSPGECCYFVERSDRPYLFTGDTVFIRDCGRTDFVGGSTAEMFASLQRIKRLSPETVILCGHHYKPECASTIGKELEDNPPFRCRTVAELEALP